MKKSHTAALMLLLMAVTAVGTMMATSAWWGVHMGTQMEASPAGAKVNEIESLLENFFIDSYDPELLSTAAGDGAAAAMIAATGDRWSYYIPKADMEQHQELVNNSYVGIGVTIQEVENGEQIVSVTAGGPAEEAGIQEGDILIAVEGEAVTTLGSDETKNRVRGEEGTFVGLTLLRGEQTLEVQVERRSIVTPVAEYELLDNQIALIKIHNFDYHCAEQTIACIERAQEEGAKALLFDVRFNGGGFKDEMVQVLDVLLPEGELFRSVDYEGEEDISRSDAACVDLPMAVLVNEDSYSAAEFFAAALQEYGVAQVVGVQTSGKGNFQYTFDLSDGSAVAISCGKYFTPEGKSLTDVGVTPDRQVELEDAAYEKLYYGALEKEEDPQLQAGLELLLEKVS